LDKKNKKNTNNYPLAALAIAADTGLVAKACAVWAESAGRRQRPMERIESRF